MNSHKILSSLCLLIAVSLGAIIGYSAHPFIGSHCRVVSTKEISLLESAQEFKKSSEQFLNIFFREIGTRLTADARRELADIIALMGRYVNAKLSMELGINTEEMKKELSQVQTSLIAKLYVIHTHKEQWGNAVKAVLQEFDEKNINKYVVDIFNDVQKNLILM